LAVARDLDDRAHLDAGLLHRHQQVRQAVVSLGARLGAAQHEAPVGPLRPRGPDLLALDDPLAALQARARLHVREVGAGVRLGVALAPDRLAARAAAQETLFLLLAAERGQGGREQPLADVAEPARPAGARVLLVPDHLLDQRRAAPARLARPAEPDPARLAEPPLPRAALLDHRVLVARAAAPAQRRERAGQAGDEPCSH